jgi:ABC-type sugar transport system substrate-binding protein
MKSRGTRGRAVRFAGLLIAVGLGVGVAAAVAAPHRPPYVKKFSWGTFHLAPRIAKDLQTHKKLSVVFSINGTATPVYGPQYEYAFPRAIAAANKQYKKYHVQLSGKIIGPVQSDPTTQINQLESAIAAGQVDCLALTPATTGFNEVVNKAVAAGIPVFTAGSDADGSHRFSTFETNWPAEGKLAAETAVKFFQKHNITLKYVAMASGGATTQFAQERMTGFYNELQKLVPSVTFLNTPSSALNTTFDPGATYSQTLAYLQGHQNVQLLYQTDIAGGVTDKAINDAGLKGKTFVIGHNVDLQTLAGIKDGTAIATLDQNYIAQASFPARACAAYFATGKILPNTNVDKLITAANVDAAPTLFKKTTGG